MITHYKKINTSEQSFNTLSLWFGERGRYTLNLFSTKVEWRNDTNTAYNLYMSYNKEYKKVIAPFDLAVWSE